MDTNKEDLNRDVNILNSCRFECLVLPKADGPGHFVSVTNCTDVMSCGVTEDRDRGGLLYSLNAS